MDALAAAAGHDPWRAVWPTAVVAVILLLVPGWALARSWNIRGVTAVGTAPALLLGVIGPATALAGLLEVRWDIGHLFTGPAMWLWAAGVLLGLVVTLSAAGRGGNGAGRVRRLMTLPALGRRRALLLSGALALAGLMTALPALIGTRGPHSPPQASDAVFHLSAVAFIREEGNASPWDGLSSMYDGAAVYYPTGWHALAALLPGDVVVGANILVLLVAGLVWPLGMAALLREVLGRALQPTADADGSVLAAATALSGSVVSVLLLLTSTWPYGLSVSLLPAALALVVRGCAAGRAGASARFGALAMAALGCIGVVTAHGTGVFNLFVLGGPVGLAAAAPLLRRVWCRGGAARTALLAVASGGLLVIAVGIWVMRSSLTTVIFYQRPGGSLPETVWAVLTDHPLLATFDPWYLGNCLVALLALLGAIAARRTPGLRRWCAGTGAAIILILLVAGPDWPPRFLAGPWYTQRARIMPLVTIGLLVLAAWGMVEAQHRWGDGRREAAPERNGVEPPPGSSHQWRRRTVEVLRRNVPAAVLIASLVLAPAWRWSLKKEILQSVHDPARIVFGTMLTDDELALIRRAPAELPADAVVLGDPSNGSAYLWSISGVRVLYLDRRQPLVEERIWLGKHLDEIGTNPRVCRILTKYGADYYYTDDTVADGATGGGRQSLWGGALNELPRQYLQQIDRTPDGAVALWRITACD